MRRRDFLKVTSLSWAAAQGGAQIAGGAERVRFGFGAEDSLYHGPEWETLNPGFWKVEGGALRRRLENYGDRARNTGFPFHAATRGEVMEMAYDPSQPMGIIYRRDTRLEGEFSLEAGFTFHAARPEPEVGDEASWRIFEDGYGFCGLALGAQSLFESYHGVRHGLQVGWGDDGKFRILSRQGRKGRKVDPSLIALEQTEVDAPELNPGDTFRIELRVTREPGNVDLLSARLRWDGGQTPELLYFVPRGGLNGFAGIAARGLIDFSVNDVAMEGRERVALEPGLTDCQVCYPLGDTLKESDGAWTVRFVALFDSDGERMEIRIAEEENPAGGWETVPVAGSGAVVNHAWRRNTAVVTARLPGNPAERTHYYTVWKDGIDVTADPRIGSGACGPGTGLVGDVPASGLYVGRLPQLTAPYKICGLSCHALTSGLQVRDGEGFRIQGGGDVWQMRDQPTVEAYRHLEDYGFQIMLWEDDVWYMELMFYPPSTDDAFQVVKKSICGPASRWQMMRHWNVINPGDHDYGMDDVKGPEQIVIRQRGDLGQDPDYMRRNFQIVHHLVTGEEEVDPLVNPKKWRAWKMPARDFTLVVLDARLWRSSQDTGMWEDEGWGHVQNLYDRTDPTRSLLGEEQFGWLQRLVETDSSPLIGLTGLNGLHTIWAGTKGGPGAVAFDQRDRVTADYAGWVKAGADRVLDLLASRDGVVTVYGDVHNGSILRNRDLGVIECSFGPIGRSGGRAVIPGFGPAMRDWDGREIEVFALYHKDYADPGLAPHGANDPFYWNFLEMEMDPRGRDGRIGLRLRNLIDPPGEAPRGGSSLETRVSATGKGKTCRLPEIRTLPDADIRFATADGAPLRGTRSDGEGRVWTGGLSGVAPGSEVVMLAFDGRETRSEVLVTLPLEEEEV